LLALPLGVLFLVPSLRAQCPDGSPPPCGPVVSRLPRIQVLPFSTLGGDTASAYLAHALTDDLRATLNATGAVVVLASSTARRGADFHVSGTVSRTGDLVRIATRMVRPATAQVVWTTTLNRHRRDLPGTADTIAAAALSSLGLRAARTRSATLDPQLFDLVSRGRYQMWRRSGEAMARAITLFSQAIAYDSSAAVGWAWLARCYIAAKRWGLDVHGLTADSLVALAVTAGDRAAELDPGDPTVWLMRASVANEVQATSRGVQIGALRRAVTLDPRLAEAWQGLGGAYEDVGDTMRARLAFERAVALTPDDALFLYWLAMHKFWAREYDEAATWMDSAITMDPTLMVAHGYAAQIALARGRLAEAETHATAFARLSRGVRDIVGGAEVRVRLARGDTAGAQATQRSLVSRVGTPPPLHSALTIAEGYLALGDTVQAIATLAAFPVIGDLHFQLHLRREPGLDGLRALPAFQRLLTPLPGQAP
jgi:TolB-like protein